jgi:hypothetical protein
MLHLHRDVLVLVVLIREDEGGSGVVSIDQSSQESLPLSLHARRDALLPIQASRLSISLLHSVQSMTLAR